MCACRSNVGSRDRIVSSTTRASCPTAADARRCAASTNASVPIRMRSGACSNASPKRLRRASAVARNLKRRAATAIAAPIWPPPRPPELAARGTSTRAPFPAAGCWRRPGRRSAGAILERGMIRMPPTRRPRRTRAARTQIQRIDRPACAEPSDQLVRAASVARRPIRRWRRRRRRGRRRNPTVPAVAISAIHARIPSGGSHDDDQAPDADQTNGAQ